MAKTLALVAILKDEKHNLERFLSSYNGAVDHVYLCDTGSTDGSIEWIEKNAEKAAGCPVSLTHFKWCDDFAQARNYALKDVKEDYWMWSDLDDVLAEKAFFGEWKKSAMQLYDAWFVPYHYGFDAQGVAICKFIRERVFRTDRRGRFSDFVHEGVRLPDGCTAQAVNSWHIDHLRTAEEQLKDRSRNLDLLLNNFKHLSPRLHCYLGKEFFDNGKIQEAAQTLEEVVKYPEAVLDLGDRVMALQYLATCYQQMGKFELAIKYAHIGVLLDPYRAEFHCIMGDSYFALNNYHAAIPSFRAATGCVDTGANGMGKLFTYPFMYNEHPRHRLAQLYYNIGQTQHALDEVEGLNTPEANELRARVKQDEESKIDFSQAIPCEDIVFTCFSKAYDWDEKIYQEKGIGGSETACVEIAAHLAKLTTRQVKVFQEREDTYTAPSGVVYIPLTHMKAYFSKWKPWKHIAWRHNVKVTDASTYLWCHDLFTPGGEQTQNYDKMICLSNFHKSYVQSIQGIKDEKVWMSRNGLKAGRFDGLDVTTKVYGKVIWPNSPDRGLDYAMLVMDEARKELPGLELHVFYGMENLPKYGRQDLYDKLEAMMKERPWVKYHGNVDQLTLARAMASSEVWLYTANFIESFCITAIEALATRCWPIVREIGALPDTLAQAKRMGMAEVHDWETTPSDIKKWSQAVVEAIELRKWQDIHYDITQHSWESVAKEWVKEMDL